LQQTAAKHRVVVLNTDERLIVSLPRQLGAAGEAYFVHQVQEPVDEKDYLASPLPSPVGSVGDQDLAQAEPFVAEENASAPLEPEDEEDAGHVKRNEASERLMWGWGALPSVRPGDDAAAEDGELPHMVKSASVYFDAVDIEATAALTAGEDTGNDFDHPSMSLCGHLLDDAETEEDVHRIFAEHIVTFDFFRANPAVILADPNLRFFVDGKVATFDADMQAYLVSRVLFPFSQHLAVGTLPNVKNTATKANAAEGPALVNKDKSRGETSCSSVSRSALARGPSTLAPLPEGCSDDGGSTQDTASITSEPYFRKSLQPSQEELLEMGLRVGTNNVEFVLRAQGAGELARISAKFYLWPVTAKVVIAQIDGAISSSAATGSMFKRRDPAAMHPGAVEFYSKLARNGYRVVYVTCHGLSQANLLHTLLHNSAGEDGELALPLGPVLLSPDRLLATHSNEMIDAQGFKVAALDALRALFPREVNPFYAAFGITQDDSVVFTQVGVFSGKVFVVDPTDGSLRHRSLMGFHESYTSLLDRMDAMVPPIYSPMTQAPAPPPSSALVVPALKSAPSSLSVTSQAEAEEELVSEAVASQVRTRSLADEAYNDLNFWRIEPGLV